LTVVQQRTSTRSSLVMDFVKNFFTQVVNSMPTVTKVAYATTQINNCLKALERTENQVFRGKFAEILLMFVNQELSVEDTHTLLQKADGMDLTREQVAYFMQRVFDNRDICSIIRYYIDYQWIDDHEVEELAEFIVNEVNNAIMYT
jgi:Protein of unknown function (DUF1160)